MGFKGTKWVTVKCPEGSRHLVGLVVILPRSWDRFCHPGTSSSQLWAASEEARGQVRPWNLCCCPVGSLERLSLERGGARSSVAPPGRGNALGSWPAQRAGYWVAAADWLLGPLTSTFLVGNMGSGSLLGHQVSLLYHACSMSLFLGGPESLPETPTGLVCFPR